MALRLKWWCLQQSGLEVEVEMVVEVVEMVVMFQDPPCISHLCCWRSKISHPDCPPHIYQPVLIPLLGTYNIWG